MDIFSSIEPIAELSVIAASDDRRSREGREIFEALDVPVYDDPEAALAAAGGFDGVVTYSELQVLATAELAERWHLPGISRSSAETLRSKLAQRQRLAACGCDDVAHLPARTLGEIHAAAVQLGLPVVVKPDGGWASREVHRVAGQAELEALTRTLDPDEAGGYVVERFLQGRNEEPFGDYVSVEVVLAGGAPVVLAVTGKLPLMPPFREPGQFWPSHLSAAEKAEVCDFVLAAVRAVGIECGALHVEVKLCLDGPHIIELNGRLGGFVPELIKAAAGVDLIALAAEAALGRRSAEAVLDERRNAERRGVRFQVSSLVPPNVAEFVDAPGAKELGRRTDVDFYRVLAKPGDQFGPSVETREMDLLQGAAADHEQMFDLIAELRRQSVFHFRDQTGALVALTGEQVARRNL